MRSGYKVTLGILTIMILLTITVGTSYSFYSAGETLSTSNSMATTCFDISYTDSNIITMNNAYPISDASVNSKVTPYTFTVTNTCTASNAGSNKIKFDISINTLTTTTHANGDLTPYLKYRLDTVTPTAGTGTVAKVNASAYTLNSSIKSANKVDKSYGLITNQELAPGASKKYNLYLWIDESSTLSIANYNFEGKVLAYAYMS